jgi:hypothetical protein
MEPRRGEQAARRTTLSDDTKSQLQIAQQSAAISPPPQRTIIRASEREYVMFWTGFFIGFAACLAIGLTAHFVHDRRQRAAFIASLSPAERQRLRGFETVKGNWHEFRDYCIISSRPCQQKNHCRGNAAIGPYPAQAQEGEDIKRLWCRAGNGPPRLPPLVDLQRNEAK